MIVYFCIGLLLVNANAYKYLDVLSSPYSYSEHGSLNNYVASIKEMPYHVLIVYSSLYCSGSLVRSKVIVTAASCFVKWQSQKVFVKVGAETITGIGPEHSVCVLLLGGRIFGKAVLPRQMLAEESYHIFIYIMIDRQVIEVVAVKKHEYFGHRNDVDNDIALLMLKDHVKFGPQVKKIVMIEPEMALRVGTALDVSGWASTTLEPLKYANSLLWSEMMLLPAHDCTRLFPNIMTQSNFCVNYSPERRISDNGGPIVFRGLLVGVLSFGADSSVEPYVAVTTNVSYFHRWINLNVKRFLKKYCVEPVDYAEHTPDSDDTIETWR